MIWITDATYIKDYILLISFSNGVRKSVDLQNELDEGVFIPLKDKAYFKRFHISANKAEWENGADFAPEFLYTFPEYGAEKQLTRQYLFSALGRAIICRPRWTSVCCDTETGDFRCIFHALT